MQKYEYLIVGSGAGGATLARELSRGGKKTAVVEKGRKEDRIGTLSDALRYFDGNKMTKMPKASREGVILWRTTMAGGSTVVSCGNGTRCLESELAELGISLNEELEEARNEMGIAPIDSRLLSRGSEALLKASEDLGYDMKPMPKFINSAKCRKCGHCSWGCAYGAKWTALNYLDEAKDNGVDVFENTEVRVVEVRNGKACGVKARSPGGPIEILADVVILAAGGLGTPVILQQSQIRDAGSGLFVDLLVNTYGVIAGISLTREPNMALLDSEFYESDGFILSPFIADSRLVRFAELGVRGALLPSSGLVGIMTKTADEPSGRVFPNGSVSKPVTDSDRSRLERGSFIAKEILIKAGADEGSILVSRPEGGHPGGTSAIGRVVDKNLRTEVENLYVCDASVLPQAPGLPPILTIVALAKRLARLLTAR